MNKSMTVILALSLATCAQPATSILPLEADDVVQFWLEAGPDLWFAKDPAFDQRFRERFQDHYEAARCGSLGAWMQTATGALALVILLDQYPRNAFRGTPQMYSTDDLARQVAGAAIASGHDRAVRPEALQKFFYLPFAHSEDLADQERAVALVRRLGQPDLGRAEHHRDIIRRFGRFPHRNPILGRTMTADERVYLDDGGYQG